MNDVKRRLRIQDIEQGGDDGFVCLGESCGCGLADPFPCGDGPYANCHAAKEVVVNEYTAEYCDGACPGDMIYVESHRVDEWR
jgi:hypothetical protein